jgi:haloacetate dehalogenase
MPGFDQHRINVNNVQINCVKAGNGPPLLLLHGHPQNLIVWRKVAQAFVDAGFSVIAADLRGYGDSSKPDGGPNHVNYSKRAMATDQVELMRHFGHQQFCVLGHDRGGRVAHRLALDYPDAVSSVVVIDIAPTTTMYAKTDMEFATRYFWWFFLIQDAPLPETLIGHDPEFFLRKHINTQLANPDAGQVSEAVFNDYLRCYQQPGMIHAVCEDYRAAATIDLQHDKADSDARIQAPLLALWGEYGTVGKLYDVLQTWQDKAQQVSGRSLPCAHSLMEEQPELFISEVLDFMNTIR